MALSLLRYSKSNDAPSKDSPSSLFHLLKQRNQRERERCKAIVIENGDVLPENVLVEILSWLPVKTLMQFKTVCRSWHTIITSRQFISKHLNNYYNTNDSDSLLVHLDTYGDGFLTFSLLVDQTPKVIATEVLPFLPLYEPYVCGPCRGIYYVFRIEHGDRALWNPATNELKVLPPLIEKPNFPPNFEYANHEAFGFAYDPVDEDYKVVVVKKYSRRDYESGPTHPSSLFIYSLKSDSWRYWGDLPQKYDGLRINCCYIFLNRCFYWLGPWPSTDMIISYDLASDSIQEIHPPVSELPLPEDLPCQGSPCEGLAIYRDSLAFLSIHDIAERFEIWTRNEGVWTKILTMSPPPIDLKSPHGQWKNNMFFVQSEDRRLVLCDPETQELSDFGFHHGVWCNGVFTYKESLVSIKDLIQQLH